MTTADMTHEQSLYRQILGRRWDDVPASIRALHDRPEGHATFRGRGHRARRLDRSATCRLNPRLSPRRRGRSGRNPLRMRQGSGGLDPPLWRESPAQFATRAKRRNEELLAEDFGPFRVLCALEPRENRLHLSVRAWSFLGLPLPLLFAPGGRTFEEDRDGLFHFHVEVESPLTGLIVRYRGWLRPAGEPTDDL